MSNFNKPSFWTILGTIGQLSADISEAYANDNKIDINEIIDIGANVVNKINVETTENTEKYIQIVKQVATWLQLAADDNRITAREGLMLIENISKTLGYDFDKTGIKW